MRDEREENLIEEHEIPEEEPVQEEPVQEEESFQQETPEPEDWRVQALRNDPSIRERFDNALFGQRQESTPAPDPVSEAQSRLRELDDNMPVLDENNMTAAQVTKFMNWQNERSKAQQAVYDARLEQQQSVLQQQQGRSQLEDYIQQAKTRDPNFKDYEGDFRRFISENNIDPRLLGNRTVIEMIRKATGYDHLQTHKRKAKAPGAPPVGEQYTEQGRTARDRKARDAVEQLREATDTDVAVAAFYRMPVQDYIRLETEFDANSVSAPIPNAVNYSPDKKLRQAGRGYERYLRGDGS